MNIIEFPAIGIKLTLNRIAFSIPFINGGIHWYAVLIIAGIIIATFVCERELDRLGERQDNIYDLLLWCIPAAVIGARLYYVLFSLESYIQNPMKIFAIWEGGLAIYGGVIAAFLVVVIYCRRKKLSIMRYLDVGAYGFLIGQIIGRWGNFVNGEAFGGETTLPWGMSINGAPPVHPTFLYESLWNLIGFLYIWLTRKKKGFDGRAISLYLIWYGIGRFMIEGLRTDSLMLGNLRISQLVSVVAVIAGVICYFICKNRHRNKMEEAEAAEEETQDNIKE